ncbi:MAG TPA: hypothetical protein VFJ58_25350 [Armatimonadota bacterium]|nr:hypothetical protein [Armatimonadota bacterium]
MTAETQAAGAAPAKDVAEAPLAGPGRAVLPDGSFDYRFDGRISRGVLENYLARAITEQDLLKGSGNVDDNIRMLKSIGAKFAGRSIILWGGEATLPQLLATGRPIAQKVHAADPDIILEAAEFEIVTRQVDQLAIPDWVFREFKLPVEARHFRYEDMLYPDGRLKDQWGRDASVPDMSRLETRLWFFYLAASYINIGVEAIHFGQVELMDKNDRDHAFWFDELTRIRYYATVHARRHLVLCDAHVPSGGIVRDGKLLLDFHAFPLRIKEIADRPHEAKLQVGFLDSLYGRSKGGITPSGWSCEHLPYLVEFDNYGASGHEGEAGAGDSIWIWGYDEIGWFAHQNGADRNAWLKYAWNWLRTADVNGYVEMPGSRTLAAPVDGNIRWYWANTASPATPTGFGQEETIKEIWAHDTPKPADMGR